jgi:transcriptional regulator with XRE-family HTH domain
MNGAELLKAWRQSQPKPSLVAVSRVLDCDPSTLSLLESGKRKPGLELALKIEARAGIPVEAWSEPVDAQPPTVATTMTPVNAASSESEEADAPQSSDSGTHAAVSPDADGDAQAKAAGNA